jgi:hypothetical protein
VSTRPTGAHPSPEEVDALLDPSGGEPSVAAHVSGCAACASVRDALAEVRSLLRAEAERVPEPPADLSTRISAALAAAGPLDSEREGAGAVAASADVVPLDSRRRRAPRWLAVAAGVAVLGGVGLTTAQLVGSGLGGADSTAGSAVEEAADADAAGPEAPSAVNDGVRPLATGTDYDPAILSEQVEALVADVRTGDVPLAGGGGLSPQSAEGSGEDGQGGALTRLSSEAGIADCLQAIGAGGETPVAVDLASYQGDPAAVIVLRSASGGLDVWVVAPTCAPGDDGLRQFTHLDP